MTAPCSVGPVSSLPCLHLQALRRTSIPTVSDVAALLAASPSRIDIGDVFARSANAGRPERYRIPANLYCLPRVPAVNST
jgi:hypothetical protein